jgi:hypothetical protein
MPKIDVDEGVINDLVNRLKLVRNQISMVRNGSNPSDPGYPGGFRLTNIAVLPGGPNWQPGADLKARLLAIDQKLDHYSQALLNLLNDSDNTEKQNIFLAQFMGGK